MQKVSLEGSRGLMIDTVFLRILLFFKLENTTYTYPSISPIPFSESIILVKKLSTVAPIH